jgi:hypothetical protein
MIEKFFDGDGVLWMRVRLLRVGAGMRPVGGRLFR